MLRSARRWISPRRSSALLLSTGPEHRNLETAVGLSDARRSRAAPHALSVPHRRRRAARSTIRACGTLPDRGAKLFVCAYGCQKRGLPLRDADTRHLLRPRRADGPDQRHRSVHRAQLSGPLVAEHQPVLVVIAARSARVRTAPTRPCASAWAWWPARTTVVFVLRGPARPPARRRHRRPRGRRRHREVSRQPQGARRAVPRRARTRCRPTPTGMPTAIRSSRSPATRSSSLVRAAGAFLVF